MDEERPVVFKKEQDALLHLPGKLLCPEIIGHLGIDDRAAAVTAAGIGGIALHLVDGIVQIDDRADPGLFHRRHRVFVPAERRLDRRAAAIEPILPDPRRRDRAEVRELLVRERGVVRALVRAREVAGVVFRPVALLFLQRERDLADVYVPAVAGLFLDRMLLADPGFACERAHVDRERDLVVLDVKAAEHAAGVDVGVGGADGEGKALLADRGRDDVADLHAVGVHRVKVGVQDHVAVLADVPDRDGIALRRALGGVLRDLGRGLRGASRSLGRALRGDRLGRCRSGIRLRPAAGRKRQRQQHGEREGKRTFQCRIQNSDPLSFDFPRTRGERDEKSPENLISGLSLFGKRLSLGELRSTSCRFETVLAQRVAGSHSVTLFFRYSLDPFPQLLTAA